jgi:anaphase-promoting complex subunit 8
MALTSQQQAELHAQLQQAITACNERCLYFAAKWYSNHTMSNVRVAKE